MRCPALSRRFAAFCAGGARVQQRAGGPAGECLPEAGAGGIGNRAGRLGAKETTRKHSGARQVQKKHRTPPPLSNCTIQTSLFEVGSGSSHASPQQGTPGAEISLLSGRNDARFLTTPARPFLLSFPSSPLSHPRPVGLETSFDKLRLQHASNPLIIFWVFSCPVL